MPAGCHTCGEGKARHLFRLRSLPSLRRKALIGVHFTDQLGIGQMLADEASNALGWYLSRLQRFLKRVRGQLLTAI